MSASERFARFLSALFHPLWMPVFLFAGLVWVDPLVGYLLPPGITWFVFPLLLVNALAPAFSIWVMARGGFVTSVRLAHRKERFWPILLVVLYYGMTYGLIRFASSSIPWVLLSLILSVICNLLVALAFNFFVKTSLHMLALGGSTGAILALQMQHGLGPVWLLLAVMLLSGLVAWARLRLSAHSPREVYLGYALGAGVSFLVIRFEWVL